MGMADIVPGVSGGTVALIVEIYDELIRSISSVNKQFVALVFTGKLHAAWEHINGSFLAPLLGGILLAIISMSKIIHFLMNEYGIFTWSLFFGLIVASVFFVGGMIKDKKQPKILASILAGTIIGYLVVSMLPVQTPNSLPMIFMAGSIAICAMILPGISGSFILLILGKYIYVTSALKSPFAEGNLLIIAVFAVGCLVGLIAFSKLLNYLLKNFHEPMMAVLLGFMIGSLRKIWPWKTVLEQKVVRGKTHVLSDALYFPTEFTFEVIMAFAIMIFGIVLVFSIEKISQRRVSSAG